MSICLKTAAQGGMMTKDWAKKLAKKVASLTAAVLMTGATAGSSLCAQMLSTSASVRPNNSLLVDVEVTASASVSHVLITYQTVGVDALVSRFTQVSATGSTTITIG